MTRRGGAANGRTAVLGRKREGRGSVHGAGGGGGTAMSGVECMYAVVSPVSSSSNASVVLVPRSASVTAL